MVRLDNWGGEGGVRNPFWGARCSTGNGCGCYLDTIDIVVRRITYVMMIPYIAMCCESVASGQSLHMLLCFFSLCASVVYHASGVSDSILSVMLFTLKAWMQWMKRSWNTCIHPFRKHFLFVPLKLFTFTFVDMFRFL